jgi:hypothetical protein
MPLTPQQKKKLERLSEALEEAQAFIRDLLQEQQPESEHEPSVGFDYQLMVASLKHADRGHAMEQLSALKQYELGAIFVECGGPSSDRKKPKVWLIEQILWRLFDFERGHEAIRKKGGPEN